MTQIVLLRHGLVRNPQKIIYGALPGFGLDPEGLVAIDQTAARLSEYLITAIYTSPLQRARETVERIQRQPQLKTVPVTEDARLREWVFVSEGLTYPQLEERYPELFEQYKLDPTKIPGQIDGKRYETFAELEQRVADCIEAIRVTHLNETIVVVSHGDPMIMAMAHYLRQPFTAVKEAQYPRPAQTRTLQFDHDRFRLSEWPE